MTHQQILEAGIIELLFGFADRHLHLRKPNDNRMQLVLPASLAQAHSAIIMPNTEHPHIIGIDEADQYLAEIKGLTPDEVIFNPYLTLYLTDNTEPEMLEEGFLKGKWIAAKLYPANATTGSAAGVTNLSKISRCLFKMAQLGMPLLVHGEVVDENTDPLDMEKRFIDEVLLVFLLENFPNLKIVMEHITTKEAAEVVGSGKYQNLFATITPHHLVMSHKHLFQTGSMASGTFRRGVFPDRFCLPIAKTDLHTKALQALVASGCKKVGAGTDSAPHTQEKKYGCCGAAGCFVAPIAVQMYAHAFEKAEALHHLGNFLGVNMLEEVYGIKPRQDKPLVLKRGTCYPDRLGIETPGITVLDIGEPLNWELASA